MRGSIESPDRPPSKAYLAGDYSPTRTRGIMLRRRFHLKTSSALLGVFGLAGLCQTREAAAQQDWCPPGSYTLQTQADVDRFPSCGVVSGNLSITSSVDITNLNALSRISFIVDALVIADNAALTNLDGLHNLSDVGRSITITRNNALTNVDGLAGLQTFGNVGFPAFVRVVDNPVLARCSCGLYGIYAWTGGWLPFELNRNAPGSDCTEGTPLRANACTAVGREHESAGVQPAFSLDDNYPNPFYPTTTISYSLTKPAEVTLTVTDLLGRQLQQLAIGQRSSGSYDVSFDATGLPAGVYLYQLQAGNHVERKRMMVLK